MYIYTKIIFHGDCYESAGKGGLAVCTSAEGAVDIVVDDDDDC